MSSASTTPNTTTTTTGTPDSATFDHPILSQSTADVYDIFLDGARVPTGVGAWRSYGSVPHFAGPVWTIKCHEDNSRVRECAASSGRGRVMVVDAGGSHRCAVLGDAIARTARDNGWRGIVVYGCVRDVPVLRTLDGFGVVALGSTPRKSTRRGEGQTNLTIQIGNVQVGTGDYVIADADGILFLTQEQVQQWSQGPSPLLEDRASGR